MQTTAAIALLAMLSGPAHAIATPVTGNPVIGNSVIVDPASSGMANSGLPGSDAPDFGQVRLVRVDSAHTLVTPNAPDPGRAGQLYQLPQGGFGVTTGGTSHYQTLGMPGSGGIAVPNGNNTSSLIGSGGRTGNAYTHY